MSADLARLQIVTKTGGPCTKSLLIVDGKLVKNSGDCWISSGTVKTVEVSLADLPGLLIGLKSNQALVLSNAKLGERKLVRRRDAHPDAVTRTRDVMEWQEGSALILIDIDPSGQYQPESSEQAFEDVERVIPGFKNAAKVVVHSTSSHVSTRDGERLTGAGGYHVYVIVMNVAQLPSLDELRRRVEARFFLEGNRGYIAISAAGVPLKRGPVDAAVFTPERLVFEADPILGEGLVQDRPAPEYIPGDPLDPVAAFAPLTPTEQARSQARVNELRDEAAPSANQVRREWLERRTREVAEKTGVAPVVVREQLRVISDGVAVGDLPLTFSGGEEVTVADTLRAPEKYDGKYLADPMEPDYGTSGLVNPSKALFNARSDAPNAGPFIWSFAHGGIRYEVRHSRESLEETLRELGGRDAHSVEVFHHMALTHMPSASERQAVIRCANDATGIGLNPIKQDLAAAENRRAMELALYNRERARQPAPEVLAALDEEARRRQREALYTDCREIAEMPNILGRVRETLHTSGVVGEGNLIGTVFLSMASSQLEKPLATKVHGDSSSGKSFVCDQVVRLFPDSFVYELTAGSARFMVYEEQEFSHRVIYLREATALQASDADDVNILAGLLREMISSGRIVYQVVVREGDQHVTRRIEKPGPVGVLITTTAAALHPENETRMISAHTDTSHDHTRAIHYATAGVVDGSLPELDTTSWHAFAQWLTLGPRKVYIPFAKALAKAFPDRPVRVRRDLQSLFSLIEASALVHQGSRRIEGGVIIADLDDYEYAAPLVEDTLAVETKARVDPYVRKLVEYVEWNAAMQVAGALASKSLGSIVQLQSNKLNEELEAAVNAHGAWKADTGTKASRTAAVEALAEVLPFESLMQSTVVISASKLQELLERDNSAVKRICSSAYKQGFLTNTAPPRTSTREFQLGEEMPRHDRLLLPTRAEVERLCSL
jgi:hypothetical protein